MLRTLPEDERARIAGIIGRNLARLRRAANFVGARPGFRVRHGVLVREPAIVAVVRAKMNGEYLEGQERLPSTLEGVPVDVVLSDPETELEFRVEDGLVSSELRDATEVRYEGLPGDPIDVLIEVHGPFLCHVGPDAGWVVLRDFVQNSRQRLRAAIYDFSASHIADAMIGTSLAHGVPIELAIDDGIDRNEEVPIQKRLKLQLQEKYDAEVVFCRSGRRFPSAYHEKVAVRDDEAFWLSSGNWTASSQPMIDPVGKPDDAPGMYNRGNREWHVIVEHGELSSLFSRYIEHDRATAKEDATRALFEPLVNPDVFVPLAGLLREAEDVALTPPVPTRPATLPTDANPVLVQPLLSPDNYAKHVRRLVESASRRLYLQYSYINWSAAERDRGFRDVLEILAERSWRDPEEFDLRIIVNSRDAAQKVRVLAENGFNEAVFRSQHRVHNKGIVADGEHVLISSQNWSGDGFLRNRDAGLILHHPEIARYYEGVFLHDWVHRTRSPFAEGLTGTIALEGAPMPAGAVRLSWRDYFGD